jgi:hypothetical protein
LRWTSKSVRKLADELKRMGHQTSHRMVAALLHELDYSLQANRKTLEGSAHPDRDAQFAHIHQQVKAFRRGPTGHFRGYEKKELVGISQYWPRASQREILRESVSMPLRFPSWARWLHMGCTTRRRIWDG